MLVLVNIYSRAVLSGWVIVLGGSVRVDDSGGFCPGFFFVRGFNVQTLYTGLCNGRQTIFGGTENAGSENAGPRRKGANI